MARHRSPKDRRTHVLPAPRPVSAGAAAGGVHSASLPALTRRAQSRLVVAALVGGSLAAAGQVAQFDVLATAATGADALRRGVDQLLTTTPPRSVVAGAVTAAGRRGLTPTTSPSIVTPDPVGAGAADVEALLKATDRQRRVETGSPAGAGARPSAVPEGVSNQAAQADGSTAADGVQMLRGRVTSGFGARWGAQHRGLDIAAPIGTPIRAPLAGTVIDSGPVAGFGLWVRVRHIDGTMTVYGHINRTLVLVGQQVAAGQVIAEVGNRGRSTGPHLHIEVLTPSGAKINPRPWLDVRGIGY